MRAGNDRISRVSITLAEALAAADTAPDVVIARAAERTAAAAVSAAKAPGAPSFTAGTNSITARESLALSAPIRWGGQRRAQLAEARAGFETAGLAREAARASARRLIRTGWFDLAAAESLARIAAERAARSRRNAEAVSAMLQSGRASRLDTSRAGVEAALAKSEENAAEQERAGAAAALGFLLSRPAGEPLETTGEPPSPGPDNLLEEALARAGARSPEVRAAEGRLREAEAHTALAHRLRLPGLAGEVGADFHDPTQAGTDKHAAVTLTVPLDGSARERIALAEQESAALELDRARRSAMAETVAAWRRASAARQRFQTLEATAIPAAREAAELSALAYREGKIDLFRLLDAERALAEVETAKWGAWRDWGAANADLYLLAGESE